MRIIEHARDLDPSGCVLVPTMGGLHDGHLRMVERGAEFARDRGITGGCIVSVFVNPAQFDEPSDFERYPRVVEEDAEKCAAAGAVAVYAPDAAEIYPGPESRRNPVMPPVAYRPKLEDVARPGHFPGVCMVLERLFGLTHARAAVFGEKDWQQLKTAEALVPLIGLRTEIVPFPTQREPDGLAMSSRNRFLSGEDRERGLSLSRGLAAAGMEASVERAERALRETLLEAGVEPDYAAVRPAATLEPGTGAEPGDLEWRAVVAGRCGSVRLLDNAAWPMPSGLEGVPTG